ncbi:MAG: hypothetical protein AB7P35_13085 [Hyphomonadaceae bacterium]
MIQTIPAHMAKLTASAAQIEAAIGQRFCLDGSGGAAEARMSKSGFGAAVCGWGTK